MPVKRSTRGVAAKVATPTRGATPVKVKTSTKGTLTKNKDAAHRMYLSARSQALNKIRKPYKSDSKEVKDKKKKWIEGLIKRDEKIEASGKKVKQLKTTNNDEWEVEEILDSRHRQGKLEFYILWEGFSITESTWEPEENLEHTKETVDEYYEMFPSNPGAAGAKPRGRAAKKN